MTVKTVTEPGEAGNPPVEDGMTFGIATDEARSQGVFFESYDAEIPEMSESGNVVDIGEAHKVMKRKVSARAKGSILPLAQALQYTDRGEPRANRHNAIHVFNTHPAWADVFGFNVMKQRASFVKQPPLPAYKANADKYPVVLTDEDYNRISTWFGTAEPAIFFSVRNLELRSAVAEVADENQFNPILDEIEGVTWDGVERLNMLAMYYLGADPGDQNTEEGRDMAEYLSEVGKRWMIAAVARLCDPGCQQRTALILEGLQNIGKSKMGEILAGEYFSDSLPKDLDGKDAARHLRDKWIVELAEMSFMSKSGVESTKAFLSKRSDNYDNKYEIENNNHPRRCVFFGTTNKSQYMKDETGNTRFWPVKCTIIQSDALREDRLQILAEALHRYHAGEPFWFTQADTRLERIACGVQGERMVSDAWEKSIADWLRLSGKEYVSVTDVVMGCLGGERELDVSGSVGPRVQQILTSLGWKYGQHRVPGTLIGPDGRPRQTRCYKSPEAVS